MTESLEKRRLASQSSDINSELVQTGDSNDAEPVQVVAVNEEA